MSMAQIAVFCSASCASMVAEKAGLRKECESQKYFPAFNNLSFSVRLSIVFDF
jgi:hypothetical protein